MTRIVIGLIAVFFICTSSKAQPASIEGVWKVEAAKTFQNMEAAKKIRYNAMPFQKKQHIYKLFENRVFKFYNDSLVKVKFQDGSLREINGIYHYSYASKRLSINVNGIITLYIVEWLPQKKMRLVYTAPSPQGLLNSLYLVPNN